ncbi:MAG: dTDP-4-dehydrorhamnose 3,5-epimerase [Eubacteriales bacterium]|nr:dTDP-4-dehydrorhamnose 3,5-epimerase [Eubacteriales bacterium]MDD3882372.1 dTDP-4-dehydrorhamnose 3,5-epimerase [Eubacteriales bacterium]MDD4512407.1 dTDP-4-dehydrorhamnose 3,5-epimerase [Eubacteriales bacterium]
MKKIETALAGVFILEPEMHGDYRGYFTETYNAQEFERLGIWDAFVQDNESFTQKKGTLRGIHFQQSPMAQSKVVRAIRGAILDVAVDLRKGSPDYLRWASFELSAENKRMLYIPRGFGHGFVTLTDDVLFLYKVDNVFSKEYDRGIRFDDPDIGVDWGISEPILSAKDMSSPYLRDSDCNFVYDK